MVAGDVKVSITTPRAFGCNMFDGVDDYVEIAHNACQLGANLSNGFTVSAWINPRSVGESSGRILDKSAGTDAQNGVRINIFPSGGNYKVGSNINVGTASSSAELSFGTWKHILVTISAAQLLNTYVNGVLSGTANQDLVQGISAITTTNVMRIGNRSQATDRTFNGSIRDVKMWNRVLTSAEITEDYAGAPNTNGLLYHYKLNGNYTNYGTLPDGSTATATNSGSTPSIVDDTVAAAIKAQRVASTDKWLLTKIGKSQILHSNIE